MAAVDTSTWTWGTLIMQAAGRAPGVTASVRKTRSVIPPPVVRVKSRVRGPLAPTRKRAPGPAAGAPEAAELPDPEPDVAGPDAVVVSAAGEEWLEKA